MRAGRARSKHPAHEAQRARAGGGRCGEVHERVLHLAHGLQLLGCVQQEAIVISAPPDRLQVCAHHGHDAALLEVHATLVQRPVRADLRHVHAARLSAVPFASVRMHPPWTPQSWCEASSSREKLLRAARVGGVWLARQRGLSWAAHRPPLWCCGASAGNVGSADELWSTWGSPTRPLSQQAQREDQGAGKWQRTRARIASATAARCACRRTDMLMPPRRSASTPRPLPPPAVVLEVEESNTSSPPLPLGPAAPAAARARSGCATLCRKGPYTRLASAALPPPPPTRSTGGVRSAVASARPARSTRPALSEQGQASRTK